MKTFTSVVLALAVAAMATGCISYDSSKPNPKPSKQSQAAAQQTGWSAPLPPQGTVGSYNGLNYTKASDGTLIPAGQQVPASGPNNLSPYVAMPYWPSPPSTSGSGTASPQSGVYQANEMTKVYVIARNTNGQPSLNPVLMTQPSAAVATNPGAVFSLKNGSVVMPTDTP